MGGSAATSEVAVRGEAGLRGSPSQGKGGVRIGVKLSEPTGFRVVRGTRKPRKPS